LLISLICDFARAPLAGESGGHLNDGYVGDEDGVVMGKIAEVADPSRASFHSISFDQGAAVQKVGRHYCPARCSIMTVLRDFPET
jgi:hypothetical protein